MRELDKQGALKDIKIVEFGQYIPGPLLGMLLSDQGASVIKVERPGGDPGRASDAFATWNRGKQSVVIDLKTPEGVIQAQNLCADADIIIENFRPGVAARLGVGYEDILLNNNKIIYCSLPGFGEGSPYRDAKGWDQTISALTGVYNHVGGDDGPLYTPLPLPSTFAAIVAAVAVTMAVVERDSSGLGQHIEVPLHSAMFTAIGRNLVNFYDNPPVHMRDEYTLPMVNQYQCSDGRWVMNHGNYKRFVGQLMEAANHPEWEQDAIDAFGKVIDKQTYDMWLERFTNLFQSRSSQDWEDSIAAAGGACTICKTIDEWLVHPHPIQGEMIVPINDPALGNMKQPGIQVKLRGTPGKISSPAPTLNQDSEILSQSPIKSQSSTTTGKSTMEILKGVKVLDLCIVLAGPTCGRTLAEYGADVIKVDDPSRPYDPTGNIDVNRGKKSVLLNLKSEEGMSIFKEMVKDADVLVQNYRKDSLTRQGLGYEDLKKINPRLIYASLNAYGFDGPWAERPGWEQIAQATSGIQIRRGGRGERPALLPYPANDYGTGMMGAYAVALALHERNKTGYGQTVDTGLCLTAGLLQSPFMLEYDGMVRNELEGLGLRGEGAHSRLYPTQDGWMYVRAETKSTFVKTLATLKDFTALSAAEKITEPSLDEIQNDLEKIFQSKTTANWIELISSDEIMVVPNISLGELKTTEWIRDLGLIVNRSHPGRGSVDHLGSTATLSRTPMSIGRPTPILGSESVEVLTSLGYDSNQIDSFIKNGVLVTEENSPIAQG